MVARRMRPAGSRLKATLPPPAGAATWNRYVRPDFAAKLTRLLPRVSASHPIVSSPLVVRSKTPSAVGWSLLNVYATSVASRSARYRYQTVPPTAEQSEGSSARRVARVVSVLAVNGTDAIVQASATESFVNS